MTKNDEKVTFWTRKSLFLRKITKNVKKCRFFRHSAPKMAKKRVFVKIGFHDRLDPRKKKTPEDGKKTRKKSKILVPTYVNATFIFLRFLVPAYFKPIQKDH